jgi:hypothetical protein
MLAAVAAPVPRLARLTSRVVVVTAHAPVVPARVATPSARERVRDSVVELDSVIVDRVHGITQGVLPPMLRRRVALDTLPSVQAEDSLRALARALAERARQVDSIRAQVDSMRAASPPQQMFGTKRAMVRIDTRHPGNSEETALAAASNFARRDSSTAELKAYFDRSASQIDRALEQYYPNLASEATPGTVVWFLADSTGRVLRTTRRDGPGGRVSTQTAAAVFGDVDTKDIDAVSVRKWTAADRHLAVAWIQLKK